jgi:hypothetical protein
MQDRKNHLFFFLLLPLMSVFIIFLLPFMSDLIIQRWVDVFFLLQQLQLIRVHIQVWRIKALLILTLLP